MFFLKKKNQNNILKITKKQKKTLSNFMKNGICRWQKTWSHLKGASSLISQCSALCSGGFLFWHFDKPPPVQIQQFCRCLQKLNPLTRISCFKKSCQISAICLPPRFLSLLVFFSPRTSVYYSGMLIFLKKSHVWTRDSFRWPPNTSESRTRVTNCKLDTINNSEPRNIGVVGSLA